MVRYEKDEGLQEVQRVTMAGRKSSWKDESAKKKDVKGEKKSMIKNANGKGQNMPFGRREKRGGSSNEL